MALHDVDTPALILDLDAFEYNLARMAQTAAAAQIKLRPHAKSHKTPEIARRQIALGAVGVCCQKVSEAEALVDGGVPNVFVSNEVVDSAKLRRLATLATRATIAVCVDNSSVIDRLDAVAAERGVTLTTLVEIDVGGNRCGVAPGEPALRLANRITATKSLRFGGLHAYHGVAQHIRALSDRQAAVDFAAAAAQRTVDLLVAHGLPCEVVTGGGTGTHALDIASGVYTEIQPGSYIFMDVDYRANRSADNTDFTEFRQSLFVYTQVMSTPGRHYAIVDAGLKAQSIDSGMPAVDGMPTVPYCRPSDEHGMLDLSDAPRPLTLGQKVKLIPGHCDPTVNLYNWIVATRANKVEAVWSVSARGPGH
jgi:3-hydroxy-D-aspartate aldolase